MPIALRQSTASQEIPLGYFLDSTDGNSEETALTIAAADIKLWKSGGTTLTNCSVGATHISNGIYYVVLGATDTDTVGSLVVFCHPAGALAVRVECQVYEEAVFDALFAASAPGYLQATVAGRTLDVTATGAAGIDWGNVENKATANVLTNTEIADVNVVTMRSNAITAAAIQNSAITSAKFAANAIDAAALAADAVTEIQSGLATAANLATVAGYLDTEIASILADTNELQVDWVNGGRLDLLIDAIKAVADKLDTALELDGAVYRYTTNSLEQAPAGGGGGATDWNADERTAIRAILGIPASGTTPDAPSAGALKVIDDFLDTEIAAILADTNELQTDWANGGRLDLLLDGAASAGDPWTTALPGAYGAGTAGKIIGDNINAPIATVDTVVDAIKAKTDNLPADPADQSAVEAAITAATSPLATAANLAIIDDFLDTEIAAILADTNELQVDWVNGGRLDLLIDAIKAKTDNLPGSPAAVGSAMTLATDAVSAAALSAGAVDKILDDAVEGSITLRQALRAVLTLFGGLSSRSGSTIYLRDILNTKTRVAVTTTSGDRTAITYDLT